MCSVGAGAAATTPALRYLFRTSRRLAMAPFPDLGFSRFFCWTSLNNNTASSTAFASSVKRANPSFSKSIGFRLGAGKRYRKKGCLPKSSHQRSERRQNSRGSELVEQNQLNPCSQANDKKRKATMRCSPSCVSVVCPTRFYAFK